ncbi:galactose-binding domain-like protein [Baffinella frigidus]|nr:galactose-binding domain-like protein [Cryptophyta sp. CCMP2293]
MARLTRVDRYALAACLLIVLAALMDCDCLPCSVGTYSSEVGASSCLDCPANATSAAGSTAASNCTCREGFTGPGGGPCTTCVAVRESYAPPAAFWSSVGGSQYSHPQLDNTLGYPAWVANDRDQNQWLAMDTGSVRRIVAVATQGRGDVSHGVQYVSSYKVSVSNDTSSWMPVDGGFIFTGNVGAGEAVVRNDFAAAVSARYVRIEPVAWVVYIAMRAGVYIDNC